MVPEQQTKKPLPKKELSEDEQDEQDDQVFGRFLFILVLVFAAQTLFKSFVSFVTASYIRMFVAAASASLMVALVVFTCWSKLDGKQGKRHNDPSTSYRGQGAGTKYSTHQDSDTSAGTKTSTGTRTAYTREEKSPREYSTRFRSSFRANEDHVPYADDNVPELNPGQYKQHGDRYKQQHMDEINRRYRQMMDDIQRRHRDAVDRNQLAFEELRYQQQRQQRRQRQEEEERQWRHYQNSQRQERPRRSSRARSKTHYDLLGVNSSATADEIRKAYKRKVLKHHPDKGGSAATFRRVQTAYETLKDDQKRRKYDSNIRWGR